jgi:tetratricopeptide (TPR) repeat protein
VRERLRSLRGPPHRKRIQRRGRIAAFLIRLPEWDEEGAEWLRLAPDRREEGVDLYARALAYRAWFHFKDEQGLALSEKAVEADPQDALVQVVRAMVLEQHERRRESLAALRRAFELQPLDPHLGLGLARRLRRSARPDEALAALQVYRDSPDLAPERAEAAARFALALQDEPRLAVGYAEVERDA